MLTFPPWGGGLNGSTQVAAGRLRMDFIA